MYTMGQTIKQLRKAKGVTQEELAGALNLTYQAVSKWENGVSHRTHAYTLPASYNKPQGQQFDTAVLSFIKLQYTEKSCKMINIFVLVTILGHLPVIYTICKKQRK